MPNRLLRESICRSESIDALSWFEEVLFYRLIVNCDDFGRFDGRPAIIKGSLFPLKDVAIADIKKALSKLAAHDMIMVYESQGKAVLQLLTWDKYQTARAQRSKYPAYDDTCEQLYADVSKCTGSKKRSGAESDDDSPGQTAKEPAELKAPAEPEEPPVITLLLNTGQEYPITQSNITEWMNLYPAVDVMQSLRNMKGWCISNPAKRKTRKGIQRFINNWLASEQNKGGTARYGTPQPSQRSAGVEEYADMARRWAEDD